MSLGTSNRDGGKTSESGHLRALAKTVYGDIIEGFGLSQKSGGANMSVDVAVGDAFVRRSDGSYAHPVFNDAVYNQVISAADGSNPRRDLVVLYVDYGQSPSTAVSNNTNGVVKIKVVNGTPAGSPVDPNGAAIQSSVGAGNPYTILGRVRVPAGQTSITNSLIDDLRTPVVSKDAPGTVKDFAGATAPLGYLLCYGQAISRTTYSALFTAIGTIYGSGDGSTTFNVPDARGRVSAGKDDMGGSSANRLTAPASTINGINGDILGQTGGAETHQLTIAQLASHNHTSPQALSQGNSRQYSSLGTDSGISSGWTSNNTGGDSPHNNVQPTIIFNKIIAY